MSCHFLSSRRGRRRPAACTANWAGMVVILAGMGCRSEPIVPSNLTVKDGERLDVTDVVKGDEVVLGRSGKTARFRMLGIFSFANVTQPESAVEFARAASTYLRAKVMGNSATVTLGKIPLDPYNRYLGYLANDWVDINQTLIAEGLVIVYTEFPFEREPAYLAAEAQARAQQLRIWSKPELLPMIRKLRQQWAEARKEHEGPIPTDPLLTP